MGLAPTGVWRVPPHPPLQLEGPSLEPKPFPPRPLPPSSPHPLWLFLQCSGMGRPSLVWGGGVLGCKEGGKGWALQRYLGPDPHLGLLEIRNSKSGFTLSVGIYFFDCRAIWAGTLCKGPNWNIKKMTSLRSKHACLGGSNCNHSMGFQGHGTLLSILGPLQNAESRPHF